MLEKNYQDINLSRSSRYDLLNQMSKAFLEKNLEDAEFAVLQFKEQEALADIFSSCCEEKINDQ